MAIFDPNDLNFNGEEIKNSSEAVFISAFAPTAVADLLTIVGGIKAKKQIAILGRFNGLLGKGTGACDPTGRSVTTPMSQKLWELATISDRLAYCWKDLEGTFFIWGTKNGIDKADLTATDFLLYIEELLATELIETYMRIAYFNDTDAELVDDGGVITDGTDLAFFNRIDGIWKQAFAIVAGDSARKTTDLASRNGQATYALQAFTSTDTTNKVVMNCLFNMEVQADSRLTSKEGLRFQVTKSVFDQYRRELTFSNISYTTERLENGMMQINAGGIPVVCVEFWDRIIREYFNNGTKWHLPHRAILTVPSNIQVGTEEESTLTGYDVFYDKKAKTTYVDFQFDIDAKIVIDHEIQLAY
jgi:hypothetical protein